MAAIEDPYIVLPGAAAYLMRRAAARSGGLKLHLSSPDAVLVVDQVEVDSDVRIAAAVPRDYEALRWGEGEKSFAGQWYQTSDLVLPGLHQAVRARIGSSISLDAFRGYVPTVHDPGGNLGIVIIRYGAIEPKEAAADLPEFTAWTVSREGVMPMNLAVEPPIRGAAQLGVNGAWPLERLTRESVVIVGIGSLGSAAASALAELGLGRLDLVDDDRLLWHNVLRHRLGNESVGRFKVNAMKSLLSNRSRYNSPESATEVRAHRLNAVTDAGELHGLLSESSVVLCCADGIAPRRTVNHLARITGKPAIFACVLADGRVGEVLRSRPGKKFGCLLCHRAWLTEIGALDAEADQEAPYGQGTLHKPMTAAPSDLGFLGSFAAKITMSTIMEARLGDTSQRLPAEHAVVGLRPDSPLRWPFNVSRAGETVWNDVPPPRAICATCSISR